MHVYSYAQEVLDLARSGDGEMFANVVALQLADRGITSSSLLTAHEAAEISSAAREELKEIIATGLY